MIKFAECRRAFSWAVARPASKHQLQVRPFVAVNGGSGDGGHLPVGVWVDKLRRLVPLKIAGQDVAKVRIRNRRHVGGLQDGDVVAGAIRLGGQRVDLQQFGVVWLVG